MKGHENDDFNNNDDTSNNDELKLSKISAISRWEQLIKRTDKN